MTAIWKFELNPEQPAAQMPKGAVILCAREQRNTICVWAEVDPSKPKEMRWFDVYGTGHEINDEGVMPRRYIGTASLMGGSLIFHVFERIKG